MFRTMRAWPGMVLFELPDDSVPTEITANSWGETSRPTMPCNRMTMAAAMYVGSTPL